MVRGVGWNQNFWGVYVVAATDERERKRGSSSRCPDRLGRSVRSVGRRAQRSA